VLVLGLVQVLGLVLGLVLVQGLVLAHPALVWEYPWVLSWHYSMTMAISNHCSGLGPGPGPGLGTMCWVTSRHLSAIYV
jgi:hypothetical protein